MIKSDKKSYPRKYYKSLVSSTVRKCLKCDKCFKSFGPDNRLCGYCNRANKCFDYYGFEGSYIIRQPDNHYRNGLIC